jgi:hypothetical protein
MREVPFTHALIISLGHSHGLMVHRQNAGCIVIRNEIGEPERRVDFGPPKGAADISGWVRGWGIRLEIETKIEGRKRTSEQIAWANACVRDGVVYCLCEWRKGESQERAVERCTTDVMVAVQAAKQDLADRILMLQ